MARGTALVTGATGALGRAVCAALAEEGWEVVGADRDPEPADAPRPWERFVRADLLEEGGAAEAVAAAGPGLRAVACLAGGFSSGPRLHEEGGGIDRMLDLNLRTAEAACRAALGALVEAGSGTICCVGARSAFEPFPGGVAYVVSKAAVHALVEALAAEYRDQGVRVNAVLPSVIDTPANREAMPASDHTRWVPPGEIAEVIAFLLGPGSAPVSGALVPVYGRA